MRNIKKILSIVFVLVLTLSLGIPAFSAANPAEETTEAGKTVVVKFEYDNVVSVNGTITFDNADLFSDVKISANNGVSFVYNPANGKTFCYADANGKIEIIMTLTVDSSAVTGDKCVISFAHEASENGDLPVTPELVTDTATVIIENAVPVVIDYTALKAEIARADALTESEYTVDSWAAMKDVYAKAVALIDNAETQAQVDDMTAALKAAIDALVKKPVEPPVVVIDYTALKAEIARADALTESEYTVDSWAAMKSVYAQATALIDNAETQAQVDDMTAALKAAIDALVKKPVEPPVVVIDYTALKAEIARADALTESEYTEDSWAAMKDVYAQATALIDNAETQAQVDDMTAALKAAIDALVKKPVEPPVVVIDYTALKAQIERADALDESKYTEDSWAAMKDVYAKAVALIDNAETQEEVDAMTEALKAAIEALVVKGTDIVLDYTELKAQIDRADALDEEKYTTDSWLEMIKAYDAAKALLNNAETQEEIDAAAKALKTAIDNLVEKQVIVKPTIDYSALLALIAKVEGLDEADYTAESWANMMAVYNKAKALINNAETQEEVDAAAAALKASVDALVKVQVTPPPTGDFALICVALILVALAPVVFIVLRKKRLIKLR